MKSTVQRAAKQIRTSIMLVSLIFIYLSTQLGGQSFAQPASPPINSSVSAAKFGDHFDQQAEEQKLAVQIITTDSSGNPDEQADETEGSNESHLVAHKSGAIPFEQQMSLMESQLAKMRNSNGSKVAIQSPKRIVINLDSLSNSTSERQPTGARLTIGFVPPTGEQQQQQKEENSDNQRDDRDERVVGRPGRRMSTAVKDARVLASARSPSKSSVRGAIMRAVHQQGGVPTLVMQESEMSPEGPSESAARMKFMLNVGDNLNRRRPETDRQVGLQEELDGLSASIGSPENEVGERAAAQVRATIWPANLARRQSRHLTDQTEQSPHNMEIISNFYNDRQPASRPAKNSKLRETSGRYDQHFAQTGGQRWKSNRDTLDEAADDRQIRTATARHSRQPGGGFESFESEPSEHGEYKSRATGKSVEEAANSMGALENKPNAHRSQVWVRESLGQTDEPSDYRAANGYPFALESANSNQPSEEKTADLQADIEGQTEQRQQRQEQQQDHNSRMDERVARLLDHLKLYTTKEQLMKVARELESYPDREESSAPTLNRLDSRQAGKSDPQAQQQQPNGGPKFAREAAEAQPAKASTSRDELQVQRNKLPPPISYEAHEHSNEPIGRENLMTVASGLVHERQADLEGARVLGDFRERQSKLRALDGLRNEEANRVLEQDDYGSQGDRGEELRQSERDAELDTDTDTIPAASVSASTNGRDIDDYTSSKDLVEAMKSGEQLYEGDALTDGGQDAAVERRYSRNRKEVGGISNEELHDIGKTGEQDYKSEPNNIREETEIRALEKIIDELVAREAKEKAERENSQ